MSHREGVPPREASTPAFCFTTIKVAAHMAHQSSVAMSQERERLVKLALSAEWPLDLAWVHSPRKWGERSELWHRKVALGDFWSGELDQALLL